MGEITLFMKRFFIFIIFSLLFIAVCMHSELKEIENYISELEKERAVENHMIEALNLAFNFIEEEQAEKAIETLKNDVIPPLEEIVEKYEQKSVKNEDLIE